jgi:TolA-binding protein
MMKKSFLKYLIYIGPMILLHGAYANEGLDLDLAILKINKEVKLLKNEILSLNDQIELINEEQRINSEKISELQQMIELNRTNSNQEKKSIKKNQDNSSNKLFTDGKNEYVNENYDQAITLFLNFAKSSPNSPYINDSKLWLARSYSASGAYLKSKAAYQDYQSTSKGHAKYAYAMFELSKILLKEFNEIEKAKLLLLDMIKKYPEHPLINKANQLLLDL